MKETMQVWTSRSTPVVRCKSGMCLVTKNRCQNMHSFCAGTVVTEDSKFLPFSSFVGLRTSRLASVTQWLLNFKIFAGLNRVMGWVFPATLCHGFVMTTHGILHVNPVCDVSFFGHFSATIFRPFFGHFSATTFGVTGLIHSRLRRSNSYVGEMKNMCWWDVSTERRTDIRIFAHNNQTL